MTNPTWKFDEHHQVATITFPTTPTAVFQFDAETMDRFIQGIGDVRSMMKPEVEPRNWPGGQVVSAVPDPVWYTEPDVLMGNTLLHIRDPRFGWLHYMIPREAAGKLASFLQAQVDAQPPAPQSDKLN